MTFTPEERRTMIDAIRRLPAELVALVSGLDDADLYTAYMPGEWTVAQNVHHLADAHMNAFIRVKLGLTEDHPAIKPYNQDRWAETVDADKLPIASSLAIIEGLHARWCVLWESLDDSQWARTVNHPERGAMTIESFLRTYANHGAAHLDQITRTLAAKPRS